MNTGIKNKDRFTERVKTKRLFLVAFLSLFLIPCSISAAKKPVVKAALSTEQEQQFKYYWYAARQAITDERYSDAYTLLQFCSWINPNDGTVLYQLGILYQGLGHAEEAKYNFEQAYESGLVQENLCEQLKLIYINEGQWEKALKMQDEIDKCAEYDALSALTRYRIYAMWGKPKQALKALDKYLEYDPANLRFLLFRLELMEQMGVKPKELYAMYDKILELDPFNLMVLNNYAYHLATHKGDLKNAERMSAITIREEPNNPIYLDTYGWILHLQGQDDLAKFYLTRAYINATDASKEEITTHLNAIK